MKRIRVLIATTDGPVEVQRITEESPEVRSVVCLNGKAVSLPISDDYDAFVREPTGVIAACFGHSSFRVDVSRPIVGGYSWQLGIFVAHALARADRLAAPGAKVDEVLFLTGEVDRDLDIAPVANIATKIARAAPMLSGLAAAGVRVTIGVPAAGLGEATAAACEAFAGSDVAPGVSGLRSARDLLRDLGLGVGGRRPRWLAPVACHGRRRAAMLRTFAAAAVILPVATLTLAPVPAPQGVSKAWTAALAAQPRLTVTAREAPAGSDCAAVHFGATPARERDLAPLAADTGAVLAASGVCALVYRVDNAGSRPLGLRVVAARSAPGGAAFRARSAGAIPMLVPGRPFTLDIPPPLDLAEPLMQEVAVLFAADRSGGDPALGRAAAMLAAARSPAQWAAALDAARSRGIGLVLGRHKFARPGKGATKTAQTLP